MKRICLDSNEVKIAAKSPCFSRIGPVVLSIGCCNSLAMISAYKGSFRLDIIIGQGVGAKTVLDLQDFTLIGATTRVGLFLL